MRRYIVVLALAFAALAASVDLRAATNEERRREYESIQKDMEIAQPDNQATNEQKKAYIELAIEKFGKFARDNPKTVEAFEGSFMLASLLLQTHHPDAIAYVELAAKSAPEAGVDVKRVVACWVTLATYRLESGDGAGAREALEKIKPLDKDIYDQVHAQAAALLEAAEQLQRGKKPFPINEKSVGGKTVTLEALEGKVVLIDFWAPWCGPCMREMPAIKALYEVQHEKGLEIVGISLDGGAEELQKTMTELALPWEIISDHGGWKSALAQKWAVQGIPKNYLLDRKGVIREVNLHGAPLQEAIEKLVAEKP